MKNKEIFLTSEEQERRDLLTSITRQSQSTDECLNCPVAKGCSWCSAYNYECFGTPNKRATNICWMHKAISLANTYYYNKGYYLSKEPERLKIYLPKEDALQIIDELERIEKDKKYQEEMDKRELEKLRKKEAISHGYCTLGFKNNDLFIFTFFLIDLIFFNFVDHNRIWISIGNISR